MPVVATSGVDDSGQPLDAGLIGVYDVGRGELWVSQPVRQEAADLALAQGIEDGVLVVSHDGVDSVVPMDTGLVSATMKPGDSASVLLVDRTNGAQIAISPETRVGFPEELADFTDAIEYSSFEPTPNDEWTGWCCEWDFSTGHPECILWVWEPFLCGP